MPDTRSSAELRSSYKEQPADCWELYGLIQEGMEDLAAGNTRPFSDAIAEIRRCRSR